MRLNSDRAHSRTASAMGDAERLVQVQVADVRAVVAWPREPHLRIEIGAVEINLPAAGVHDIADRADCASNTPCVEG